MYIPTVILFKEKHFSHLRFKYYHNRKRFATIFSCLEIYFSLFQVQEIHYPVLFPNHLLTYTTFYCIIGTVVPCQVALQNYVVNVGTFPPTDNRLSPMEA
nr:MAG TPA: hypothetical protein [Caudoviricetes sp.]